MYLFVRQSAVVEGTDENVWSVLPVLHKVQFKLKQMQWENSLMGKQRSYFETEQSFCCLVK